MKTILITKYGSVFRTRKSLSGASAAGEQGETEGIIRHLVSRGDVRVVYFGQYQGEELCEVVQSDLSFVRAKHSDPLMCTGDDQRAGFTSDLKNITDLCGHPVGFITVDGYAPTFSHIDNPNDAIIQCASINYCAPILGLLENLKIPRICINNDPRCYPKDQEMSHGWEWARPRAILGQCDESIVRTVGGKKYRRQTVYARAESWGWLEQSPGFAHEHRQEVNVVAHSHIRSDIGTGKNDIWETVLTGAPPGTTVWGKGWENYDGHHDEHVRFVGPCKPAEVANLLSNSICCPVVSHSPGFYTGKPYVLVSQGCIPLLVGDGQHSHTYDPRGQFMPLDSPWRIKKSGDFQMLHRALTSKLAYDMALCQWKHVLKPDWTLLDRLVDDLLAGAFQQRPEYGGYWTQ